MGFMQQSVMEFQKVNKLLMLIGDAADSDPIGDITSWVNKMDTKPARALTSTTVLLQKY